MNNSSFKTRWEFIEQYVKDKKVLDIGPAELTGTTNRDKLEWAIWPRINSFAKIVVGLEENEEQVLALKKMGYDVRLGDAESFDLKETFDVIVAGELIEHLSNPGLFLECAKSHLKSDGLIILTTPNRFSVTVFISAMRRNRIPKYDKPIAKHVAYYDENCLRDLLSRHGFSKINISYYEYVGKLDSRLTTKIKNFLLRRYRVQFLDGLLVAASL